MNSLVWMLAGLILMVVGGFASAFFGVRRSRYTRQIGAWSLAAGCAMAMIPSCQTLWSGVSVQLALPWPITLGTFHVGLDPLSAFFAIPICGLSFLGAFYGMEYLPSNSKATGFAWAGYNLLVASMLLVVLARQAILFLTAWEIMALASFFLVAFENERESVRRAAWLYLVAAHVSAAFVAALFFCLGHYTGSLDFDAWSGGSSLPSGIGTVIFFLALVGFGIKAGFWPFHIWLPEAHPAAPSHVSAVMSGVMIKTGIYGLVRVLTFFDTPPMSWGWTLVGIGITSGVLGVLYALAQSDLKRLLAYHSVENIGIIAIGLGLGCLGLSTGRSLLAFVGFAGGLLHVLNHAVFKGLLFLGAGSVLHATGIRNTNRLGGLLKAMPVTGRTFFIGSLAICGLPPLNGFVSEFLIYFGAYHGAVAFHSGLIVSCLAVVLGMALIGGLAAAAFTKAFGIVFLGEPRSREAAAAHEAGPAMRAAMTILAIFCPMIALLASSILQLMAPVLSTVLHVSAGVLTSQLEETVYFLNQIVMISLFFGMVAILLLLLRRSLPGAKNVESAVTWDCGYARPSARMQYTASSFAQPIKALFAFLLGSHSHLTPPRGILPQAIASFTSTAPDRVNERFYHPIFEAILKGLRRVRVLQHGEVQLYVLYVAMTLVALLIWCLR
ncbi:MAG: proton-conducting transporter membrane subunit [Verrucomicrobiae bacterium]|nr:proton-conducting transporter membrane subunit [Verrucomicrobiae bacterium]